MNDKFSRKIFCDGMRDGFPIALGYFAVSFSLGIAARHAGFTPMQGFLASLLNNASAGEYAAFTLVAAQATYLEVAIITLIANARYLLMSSIGYGEQKTGGYSIAVDALYLTDDAIYVSTSLLGPDITGQKENTGKPSVPYIVLKTEMLDKTVIYE